MNDISVETQTIITKLVRKTYTISDTQLKAFLGCGVEEEIQTIDLNELDIKIQTRQTQEKVNNE